MKPQIPFGEALRFWVRLGFISFGGPAGQIAVMQKELVEERGWIDPDDFLHALNFCMLLPGPEAQQLATYIGWRLHGIRGGIAAGVCFVLPAVVLLTALSYLYAAYGGVPLVTAALDGFKAVVVAIVAEALLRIGGRALKTVRRGLLAAAAFVAIYFLHAPFPLIVLGAALVGVFLLPEAGAPDAAAETDAPTGGRLRRLGRLLAAFAALWTLPFLLLGALYGFGGIAARVYLFFSQAAFVTFGGAYAVLAYVNQAAVGAGWITAAQAVDGLALAETTPGPLIMVLQFVGFMTGWNNPDGFDRLGLAVVCGLATTYATFLPSFLFIFAGAPYIERLRHNRRLSAALAGVTAAVVGVILNLALAFAGAVVRRPDGFDFFAAGLAVAAFVALFRFRVSVPFVIGAGGAAGILRYLAAG